MQLATTTNATTTTTTTATAATMRIQSVDDLQCTTNYHDCDYDY